MLLKFKLNEDEIPYNISGAVHGMILDKYKEVSVTNGLGVVTELLNTDYE